MHTSRISFRLVELAPQSSVRNARLHKSELRDVSARLSHEWEPLEHPDFTRWIGEVQSSTRGSILDQSPWTVDELLERPGRDWLPRVAVISTNGI